VRYYIHPVVQVIKEEIYRLGYSYQDVSRYTELSLQRIKNIMSGRSDMTLRERDIICSTLCLSSLDVIVGKNKLNRNRDFIDLRGLPAGLGNSIINLYDEVTKLHENACRSV
jgi:hypothetical protein